MHEDGKGHAELVAVEGTLRLTDHPGLEAAERVLERVQESECQAPGLMETGLSGFQGCGDRLGHRVLCFVLGGWDVAEFAV
jgi:hypothetical protein